LRGLAIFVCVAAQAGVQVKGFRVWAFTSVAADYDGAILLHHWVHHYLDLGVRPEHFLVVINSKAGKRTKEVDECAKILDDKGIGYVLWLTQYSSEIMYKYRMELQTKVDVEDWIIHADNDEFHHYGGKSVVDFLEDMEQKGINEVRGQYIDRVSLTGELEPLKFEPTLFIQFPLWCQVIKKVAGGRDFKTMAYKGMWRTDRGNHQVIRPARALGYIGGTTRGAENAEDLYHLTPYSKFANMYHYACAAHDSEHLPMGSSCARKDAKVKGWIPVRHSGNNVGVHHFKWHHGVLQSIKDRLKYYRGDDTNKPRYAWYRDSEKLLEGIGELGRVDIKSTRCKHAKDTARGR